MYLHSPTVRLKYIVRLSEDPLIQDSLMPLPLYIKEQGGGRPSLGVCQGEGGPPPSRSRTPPFLVQLGRGKGKGRRGREGGKRGCRPPLLVQFGLPRGRGSPRPLPSLSQGPCRPISSPRSSDNPRHSDNYQVTPGTYLLSEYSHPIYQSLCLDHFETPRHVRDHIRDSELPSVHQNT